VNDLAAGDRLVLAGHLAQVPDPRDPRGVRHTLASFVTDRMAAVLAGARSFTRSASGSPTPATGAGSTGVRYEPWHLTCSQPWWPERCSPTGWCSGCPAA